MRAFALVCVLPCLAVACGGDAHPGLTALTDSGSGVDLGTTDAVELDAREPDGSPPHGGTAVIAPSEAREGDTLTCVVSGVVVDDGDAITMSFTWLVDGVAVAGATDATLTSADFDRGQHVVCVAHADDGVGGTSTIASASVTIANTPPTFTDLQLGPAHALRGDTLSCAASGWSDVDPDDVSEAYAYLWERDAGAGFVPIDAADGAELAAAALSPGDRVRCVVRPLDALEAGAPRTSDSVVIDNVVPVVSVVSIEPAVADASAVLRCVASGADGDGDALTYTYAWSRDGAPVAASGETLTDVIARGESWRCAVTPADGWAEGERVESAPVVIGNALPTVASVAVTPQVPSTCATLTCLADGVSDRDAGDVTIVRYRWSIDGALTGASGSSFAGPFSAGQAVRCHASATDGSVGPTLDALYGPELASGPVVITNTPPSITSVAITPTQPEVGALLQCQPAGFSDDCATTAGYGFRWFVDGALVSSATEATLSTSALVAGAEVVCAATPRDGTADGATKTSAAVVMRNTPPTTPVVAVSAPEGAHGNVECALITPAADTQPLTYTWHFRVNEGPELTTSSATLSADQVHDCDRLRCWATVSDGATLVSSQIASQVLPLGSDCGEASLCNPIACGALGGCKASPVDCTAVTNVCLQKACNPATGTCTLPVTNGTACDDTSLCNGHETCQSGQCHAGTAVVCSASPEDCGTGACDPQTGLCGVKQDGAACDDDDVCSVGDACVSGVCSGSTPSCDCVAEDALLVWYDFDGHVVDRSEHGHTASAATEPVYASSPHGQALHFNGSQTLTISDGGVLAPTQTRARTYAFWLKMESTASGAIISQYTNGASSASAYAITYSDQYGLSITADGTGPSPRCIPGPSAAWRHWTIVLSPTSNGSAIYLDGVECARGGLNYSATQLAVPTSVGRMPSLDAHNLVGLLDELKVFDRVLTASEIQAIASSPASCP